MRNRYLITVTGFRGARHYTLTQLMIRGLAASVAFLAVILAGGGILIHSLNRQVERLDAEMQALESDNAAIRDANRQLLNEQDYLVESVDAKARELMALTDELEHIEGMIGLAPTMDLPLAQRMDTAAQTAMEKRLMLQTIPSGHPLVGSRITSDFGMRHHPVHERDALHGGIDFRAGTGTPVHATAEGVVEYAANNGNSGLGRMVRVVHDLGFATIYAHLNDFEVQVGDYVRKGQIIARSGNTGVSNAPHLHYEVRYLGRRLDPGPFVDWSMERYDRVFEQEERVQWESLAEAIRRKTGAREPPWSQPVPSLSATSP